MMTTVKCKKIKRTNYKVKDVQYKYLHHSDCLLLLNYKQQQIVNLCRLIMIIMTSYNISNVNSDILSKWCLHIIETTLKLRLTDIIDCHDDNIINKYICWKKVNTYTILCCLVKSLNYVVYEHILIKRVTKEVKRTLTAVNMNRIFI